jgi:HEAT repeat protein
MVIWDAGWEIWLLRALLASAALLVLVLFLLNRIHARRTEATLRLERVLEHTVLSWAHDDLAPDEARQLAQLRGSDRDLLLRVCFRILPSLDPAAIEGVRAGLKRWGLLDRELAKLHHRNPARRADACRLLGRLGWRVAIPALIERLADSHPLVRQRAIAALSDLGAVEALESIVGTLEATASWTDLLAIMALSRMGPESVPQVDALLRASRSPAMTKGLLQMTAQLAQAADPALVRALASHADPEVRVEAVRALGHIPADAESVAVCLTALEDPAWPTRALAARSLGRLGDSAAIPWLEQAMGDSAYWVRHHAGQALAALGGAGRDALQRRLADPNQFVRDMATQMLFTNALPGEASR